MSCVACCLPRIMVSSVVDILSSVLSVVRCLFQRWLFRVACRLSSVAALVVLCRTFSVACYMSHAVRCMLSVACGLLGVAALLLSTARCTLSVICCMLSVACPMSTIARPMSSVAALHVACCNAVVMVATVPWRRAAPALRRGRSSAARCAINGHNPRIAPALAHVHTRTPARARTHTSKTHTRAHIPNTHMCTNIPNTHT